LGSSPLGSARHASIAVDRIRIAEVRYWRTPISPGTILDLRQIANALIEHGTQRTCRIVGSSDKWFPLPKWTFVVIVILRHAFPKQAMEMTEYGKHGSQEAGFPCFPHSLEIPSGLPHSHGLDCWHIPKGQKQERPNPRPLDLKGVVMEVLGPKCNERSSTLTPLRSLCTCSFFSEVRGGVAGGNGPAETLSRLSSVSFLFSLATSTGRNRTLSLDGTRALSRRLLLRTRHPGARFLSNRKL
jgi:hypothetical protein